MYIVEDMMSSKFWVASIRASYIRYSTVFKMVIKRQSMLALLVKLGKNALAAKFLGSTYVDDTNLYSYHIKGNPPHDLGR